MKRFLNIGMGLTLLMLGACCQSPKAEDVSAGTKADTVACDSQEQVSVGVENPVVETIMARRSIRKYKPQVVEEEKLKEILRCGINAPNGMYKQSWEIRVVQSPEFMAEIEKGYTDYREKRGSKRRTHPSFGAPNLIFIAHDTTYDLSQVDCGLLGANIILSAQSMGLGTCCLGGIVRFMNSDEASDLLKRLELPESYKLLYAISLGYPDEAPAAKPRNEEKIKFI